MVGGISHETHTFSGVPTDLEKFKQREFYLNYDLLDYFENTQTEIGGIIDQAKRRGIELKPTIYAEATPGGPVTKRAFDFLSSRLLKEIDEAQQLDGVLLVLHGAMSTEDEDDGEGCVINEVQKKVGDDIPIVVTLDLHANISQLMVEKADVLIGYDTYPHKDQYERGKEAVDIMIRILEQDLVPTAALEKPPLLPASQRMRTDKSPMEDLMNLAHQMESENGVAVVTVAGGHPTSDVSFSGMGIVVITNNDPELAKKKAKRLKELAWEKRHEFVVENTPVDQAVKRATEAEKGPVILVDVGDNIGGGAPGDGTVLLESLMKQEAKGVVVVINDPQSVSQAIEVGIDEKVSLEVGGKVDDLHGDPIPIEGEVRLISNGKFYYKGEFRTGSKVNMGPTVVLDCQGIILVLTTFKTLPFDQEQLRCLGIEPKDQRIIVVKSSTAWRAAYEPIAAEIIEVDTPGLGSPNYSQFDYRKVKRPIFPLDDI